MVPLLLEEQHVSSLLVRHFDLEPKSLDPRPPLAGWQAIVDRMLHASDSVRIAVAGKYTKLSDAYLSLLKVGAYPFLAFALAMGLHSRGRNTFSAAPYPSVKISIDQLVSSLFVWGVGCIAVRVVCHGSDSSTVHPFPRLPSG